MSSAAIKLPGLPFNVFVKEKQKHDFPSRVLRKQHDEQDSIAAVLGPVTVATAAAAAPVILDRLEWSNDGLRNFIQSNGVSASHEYNTVAESIDLDVHHSVLQRVSSAPVLREHKSKWRLDTTSSPSASPSRSAPHQSLLLPRTDANTNLSQDFLREAEKSMRRKRKAVRERAKHRLAGSSSTTSINEAAMYNPLSRNYTHAQSTQSLVQQSTSLPQESTRESVSCRFRSPMLQTEVKLTEALIQRPATAVAQSMLQDESTIRVEPSASRAAAAFEALQSLLSQSPFAPLQHLTQRITDELKRSIYSDFGHESDQGLGLGLQLGLGSSSILPQIPYFDIVRDTSAEREAWIAARKEVYANLSVLKGENELLTAETVTLKQNIASKNITERRIARELKMLEEKLRDSVADLQRSRDENRDLRAQILRLQGEVENYRLASTLSSREVEQIAAAKAQIEQQLHETLAEMTTLKEYMGRDMVPRWEVESKLEQAALHEVRLREYDSLSELIRQHFPDYVGESNARFLTSVIQRLMSENDDMRIDLTTRTPRPNWESVKSIMAKEVPGNMEFINSSESTSRTVTMLMTRLNDAQAKIKSLDEANQKLQRRLTYFVDDPDNLDAMVASNELEEFRKWLLGNKEQKLQKKLSIKTDVEISSPLKQLTPAGSSAKKRTPNMFSRKDSSKSVSSSSRSPPSRFSSIKNIFQSAKALSAKSSPQPPLPSEGSSTDITAGISNRSQQASPQSIESSFDSGHPSPLPIEQQIQILDRLTSLESSAGEVQPLEGEVLAAASHENLYAEEHRIIEETEDDLTPQVTRSSEVSILQIAQDTEGLQVPIDGARESTHTPLAPTDIEHSSLAVAVLKAQVDEDSAGPVFFVTQEDDDGQCLLVSRGYVYFHWHR
eukprot:GILK01005772.1.p1 GENE.GILK01005772.1~~GILK01005772.1.p1  ORF type:complete len:910 (+),score=190.47 GILK01005772.1:41-2731(+)